MWCMLYQGTLWQCKVKQSNRKYAHLVPWTGSTLKPVSLEEDLLSFCANTVQSRRALLEMQSFFKAYRNESSMHPVKNGKVALRFREVSFNTKSVQKYEAKYQCHCRLNNCYTIFLELITFMLFWEDSEIHKCEYYLVLFPKNLDLGISPNLLEKN